MHKAQGIISDRRGKRVDRINGGAGDRARGVAAVLAMLFLVIFSSLVAAMAIVSQANLATADAQIRVNRALSSAETGVHFLAYHMRQAAANEELFITEGYIDDQTAEEYWEQLIVELHGRLSDQPHTLSSPQYNLDEGWFETGQIMLDDESQVFEARLEQHPLGDASYYSSSFYQRPPYDDPQTEPYIADGDTLGPQWVRAEIRATDGRSGDQIGRTIRLDFRLEKRIPYAVLARSRVMLGQHAMIDGPVGSRFMDTDLEHGHPIHMRSDFEGLDPDLDAALEPFWNTLIENDQNGNNRLRVDDADEVQGIGDVDQWDANNDGYIDEWDFVIAHLHAAEAIQDGVIPRQAFVDAFEDSTRAEELFSLLHGTISPPGRTGQYLRPDDRYAKIRGPVHLDASQADWEAGLQAWATWMDDPRYQDFFRGPIEPGYTEDALTFESEESELYEFEPTDFDVHSFYQHVAGSDSFQEQVDHNLATNPDASHEPAVTEEVPYGAAFPYEYYDRDVYRNMTFEDVVIPRGTNALFIDCEFIGVTFIDTTAANTDTDFNRAGMREHDGTPKFPGTTAHIDGVGEVSDTRAHANNTRFHDSTFKGSIVTGDVTRASSPGHDHQPTQYTHVRNKMQFTGQTRFDLDNLPASHEDHFTFYRRSTLLAPHYSVEMGTFLGPGQTDQALELFGTIVAGLIDLRGNVHVEGTVLTTFMPERGVEPVVGDTTPWFNVALGYFDQSHGDMEASVPEDGRGQVRVHYDPTTALPDGIRGPVTVRPVMSTYSEGGLD